MICKLVLATVLCLYMSSFLVSGAAIQAKEELSAVNNSSNVKNARGFYSTWEYNTYPYGYYPYQYYNWYNVYNTHFAVASCDAAYACPTLCPGICGVWSSLGACQCSSCPYVGDVCNLANIGRGIYLHPYAYDTNRYVQCDSTPGIFYIRNCPSGLVFDHRFQVCNYPAAYYYGK